MRGDLSAAFCLYHSSLSIHHFPLSTLIHPPRTNPLPAAPWGLLPPTMRVLYVTTYQRKGAWLAEAFAADSAAEVELHEALGTTAALTRLRDEAYDAILVSHEPGELDALEFIEGLRAGGAEEPLIILGSNSEEELAALCYEVGGDAYVCVGTTTTRTLIWVTARAIERHQLIRDNRRLFQGERQRLQHEHQEADRLLHQQRALIADLESLCEKPADSEANETNAAANDPTNEDSPEDTARAVADRLPLAELPHFDLPPQLVAHYRELLRAHVIMGFGNLAGEMSQLAEMLATAGVTAQQTMLLHLEVLEELVRGLGARSARHVMTRADLLVLEVMIHLAEGYRRRYVERLHPPQQQLLPGFDGEEE